MDSLKCFPRSITPIWNIPYFVFNLSILINAKSKEDNTHSQKTYIIHNYQSYTDVLHQPKTVRITDWEMDLLIDTDSTSWKQI